MIKGFAALAPKYSPVLIFSKRYPQVIIRTSYPLPQPDLITKTIGGKLDRIHDYYLGTCVGVVHSIKAIVKKSSPYNTDAAISAINNILDEHKADLAKYGKTLGLPAQLSFTSLLVEEAQGLDELLFHAEVVRETAAEAQDNDE